MPVLPTDHRKPRLVFTIGKGLFGETGGSQRSVCEVASLFARAGYPVSIVFSESGVARHARPRFDLDPAVRLINVFDWREGDADPGAEREHTAEAWADALDRAQPDLVIIWFVVRRAILPVHDYLRRRAIPFVCAHRMDPAHDLLGRPGRGREAERAREILEGAAAHAIQTPDYLDFFAPALRPRVWTIPNIVPAPQSPAQQPTAPAGPPGPGPGARKVILNVGRLHAQKNQALLIRAFACIADLFPDWDLHIYGEGPDRGMLAGLIALYDLGARVVLQGLRSDLAPVYRGADLFAFPSVFEGFSRAHSEAMSYGLPSLGLQGCASSRRLIGESGGGRLAENCVQSFYPALAGMLADPGERAEMGSLAARHVAQFEEGAVFAEWQRMVRAVVGDRAPARPRRAGQRHVAFSIGAFKSYVGGAEKSLAEIASHLAEAGSAVTIVIAEAGVARAAPTFYPVHPGVRLRNLYPWLEESAAVPERNRPAWLRERAHQVLLEEDPDLLVCFTMEKSILWYEAVSGTDVRYVIAHRNDPAEKLAALVGKAKDKARYMTEIFHSWDRAVAQTVQLDPYCDFFPADVRAGIVSIPNVIQPVDDPGLPGEAGARDIVLNVGRLQPQKNQALLIRAFAAVAGDFPGWQAHVYGEGPERQRLEALIEACGMAGRVRLKGTTQDMAPVYRAAKVFAFPSRFEGFSRAHGEAMAFGLPSLGLAECVSSRLLIGDSGAGLLSADTVVDFAEGLRRLMGDAALRRESRARALDFVPRFAPARVHAEWQALVEDLAR